MPEKVKLCILETRQGERERESSGTIQEALLSRGRGEEEEDDAG
jgi:hypothetical protein